MILDRIVEDKKIRLKEHKARLPFSEARMTAVEELKKPERNKHLFLNNLKKDGISIIGEFK